VPVPVALVVGVVNVTVALASVKLSVSSTVALTVIWPAVEAATVPASIPVVHAASENVAARRKNVEFVALGLVTFEKLTVCVAVGAVALAAFNKRSEPAVDVFTVHPVPEPKFPGCAVNVDELLTNPLGVVHAPLAVVQAVNDADLIAVAVANVNANAYVVAVDAADVPSVTERAVNCAADAWLACVIGSATIASTATKYAIRLNITFVFVILSPRSHGLLMSLYLDVIIT
jgi:hypothetical protein